MLAKRLGDPFTARIIAAAALAALSECWQQWAADRQIPFRIVLDAAFDRLAGVPHPLDFPLESLDLDPEQAHDL